MAWPKVVPILTSKDMYKGLEDGPCGTHCVIGWSLFTFKEYKHRVKVERLIAKELNISVHSICDINDSPRTSKQKMADVWNKVMRKLGYKQYCSRARFEDTYPVEAD